MDSALGRHAGQPSTWPAARAHRVFYSTAHLGLLQQSAVFAQIAQ